MTAPTVHEIEVPMVLDGRSLVPPLTANHRLANEVKQLRKERDALGNAHGNCIPQMHKLTVELRERNRAYGKASTTIGQQRAELARSRSLRNELQHSVKQLIAENERLKQPAPDLADREQIKTFTETAFAAEARASRELEAENQAYRELLGYIWLHLRDHEHPEPTPDRFHTAARTHCAHCPLLNTCGIWPVKRADDYPTGLWGGKLHYWKYQPRKSRTYHTINLLGE